MPEDRVIEEIRKAINDKEKTDKRMSFGGNLLILLILSIIIVIGLAELSHPQIFLLGLIAYIIYSTYIFHSLIKREEHFKRERKLLSNLILWFEGKIDEARINTLKNELRERENEEEEKNPITWSILGAIPFLGLYIYYLLMKDFYQHDKREVHMLRYIHDAMESMGTVFLIPMKPQSQDPNIHFENQKEWENRLLEAIQTPIIISPPPSDVTTIYTETKVYDETKVLFNAELILPKREIEITQNENVFGRSDFEIDLSEEYLGYITSKGDGRYHFMIIRQDGTFYIEDEYSTNGTKLNDIEIKGRGKKELKNGDKITLAGISDFTITFKISGA